MKKTLLLFFVNLVLLTGFTRVAAQTLSSGPMLSFSNATGFGDNIAQDGEGGSVAISDIDIQVMPISNSGAKLTADPLEYHDMADWNVPPMITYGGTNSFYGWTIKSGNGAEFSLVSFDFNDWGEWSGNLFTVQAFRNGSSLGSVSFAGNMDNNMVHLANPGVLSSIFQNVDEVRVYKQGGANSWVGINSIKVSSPVASLPVTWLNFTARGESNGVLLNWSTAREQNTRDFEIQHGDGRGWDRVATVHAAVNSGDVEHYSYLHNTVAHGVHYYRILQRDVDGKESYSKVIAVDFSGAQNRLSVYPNPIANGQITVEVEKEEKARLFTATGKLVLERQLLPGVQQLQLPFLQKGFYFLKAGEKTERIMVQ